MEKPKRRWTDNMRINMGGCGLDSRGRLQLVNTIAYLRIQHNAVNMMSRLATVKFSKWNSLSTPARSSRPAILKLFFWNKVLAGRSVPEL